MEDNIKEIYKKYKEAFPSLINYNTVERLLNAEKAPISTNRTRDKIYKLIFFLWNLQKSNHIIISGLIK